MAFVDTHVHLNFPDYDADREEVIQRARQAGVEIFINVGTDVETSRASVKLAEEYDFVWASAGIHPHDAKDADPAAIQAIEDMLTHPRVIAVGEIGLDFFRDHSPRETQKEILKQFLGIHKVSGKPLILHCRDAYEDLAALLEEVHLPSYRGVMHCFSSDRKTMEKFLEFGLHISFAGPLTYKKNDPLREACAACPLDRLLLETDAPFLPPQSKRGKRNESGFMTETAEVAAGLHGIPIELLGERTTENARKVFSLC